MTAFWDLDTAAMRALAPDDFAVTRTLDTRWRDNDSQGHVNNAVYYEYFDTAINGWLARELGSPPGPDGILEFVAESSCKFVTELAFPTPLLLAHRVARLGRSSATYELGIFPVHEGVPGAIAALGRWVHVFVDAATRRPVAVPDAVSRLLETATGKQQRKRDRPGDGLQVHPSTDRKVAL